MTYELGHDQFGIDILNALGIPKTGARKIVLTIAVGDIVTVEVDRYLLKNEAKQITEFMKDKYTFDVRAKE